MSQPKGAMYEVNDIDNVNVKMDALTQKIGNLTINLAATVAAVTPNCEVCGILGHIVVRCILLTRTQPNQVNYAQRNTYSNTYNNCWKNHPNFLYKNNNDLFAPSPPLTTPPGFQKGAPVAPIAPRKSNLELNKNVHTNLNITRIF